MTIVFDVSYIQRRRAGYGRLSFELLRGLLAVDRQREYLLHGWSMSLDEEAIRSFIQPNVCLSIAHIPGQIKRLYWNTIRYPSLETVVGPFDIFHGAEPLLPPVGRRASIVTLHDLAYRKFPQYFTRNVRRWDNAIVRSLRAAHAIIVPSEHTRDDLVEMLKLPHEKIHTVLPPVNPLFMETGALPADPAALKKYGIPGDYLLFVGTIEPRKNIALLVESFAQFLAGTNAGLSLVIVGKRGWLSKEIIQSIDRSTARSHIIMPDYVSDNDLAALYRSALMFIFPSLYEGHGSPVIEAMASGTPVITSDNSSLKDIGQDAAILIDPGSAKSLTEAIRNLYEDENLRRKLSVKGRERAAQFSTRVAVDRVLRLYKLLETR